MVGYVLQMDLNIAGYARYPVNAVSFMLGPQFPFLEDLGALWTGVLSGSRRLRRYRLAYMEVQGGCGVENTLALAAVEVVSFAGI
jgi:hypothetical protein